MTKWRERNNRLILFFAVKERRKQTNWREREGKKRRKFSNLSLCVICCLRKNLKGLFGALLATDGRGQSTQKRKKKHLHQLRVPFLFVPSDHLRIRRWGDSSRKARDIKFTTTIEMI